LVALSPRGSFIAHRYLSEVISIETALKNSKTDCQRKKLLRQNAYELALLHDRGAEHGDLKASNNSRLIQILCSIISFCIQLRSSIFFKNLLETSGRKY